MRCPKCNYVSFDHLDSCRKCGKDLAEVRGTLNLLDFEPNVPFLLGTLVGEMHRGVDVAPDTLSLSQETELDFAGLDTVESPTMEQTMDMGTLDDTIDVATTEDLELSALDLDDMDTEPTGPPEAPDLSLDDLAGDLEDALASGDEDESFMGLELELEEGASDEDDSLEDTLGTEDISKAEPSSADEEDGGKPVPDLDLSDDDLSALAQELEGQLDGERGDKG